eukprot:3462133-Rhodomonas_salina.1
MPASTGSAETACAVPSRIGFKLLCRMAGALTPGGAQSGWSFLFFPLVSRVVLATFHCRVAPPPHPPAHVRG